jgi:Na+/proline symporter
MIDLVILAAFVAYALSAGFRARREASRGAAEYFLAGRSLRGWQAGMSMAATQFAADTPLLVMGLVATAGVFGLWRLWVYALAFLLMAFVLSGCWRRSGVLTDAELAELRYGGRGALVLRVLKAVYYGTIINCAALAMVMVAAVRIAEVSLLWHLWLPDWLYGPVVAVVSALGISLGLSVTGLPAEVAAANGVISIVLILLFTAGYSLTGGLRSVVATDVVQLVLALVGTAVYAWFAVTAAGGLGGLSARVVELYGAAEASRLMSFSPVGVEGWATPFLVVVALQWLFQMNSDGTGYLAQRSMACRTDGDARWAGVIFAWVQTLVRSLLWVLIAVSLLVLVPFTPAEAGAEGFAAGREILYVTQIWELVPAGLRGLLLVGLLAALASTVDTHLNWGASYWSNDVFGRVVCREWLKREARPGEMVLVARLAGVGIVALSLVVMARLESIQAAWSVSLLFGAGMGVVLVLRWLWERVNLQAELACMGVSVVAAPLLLYQYGTDPAMEWVRLGTMAGLATLACVAASLLVGPSSAEVRVAFYTRVRPPGFWGGTAVLAGEAPGLARRALGRRLIGVGVTAGSLYLLLVGVGRAMLDGGMAGWAMAAVGVALVPVWWREALREDRE